MAIHYEKSDIDNNVEGIMTDQHDAECCTHGKQAATYVCQHILQTLQDSKPRGFWSAEVGPGELHPDSWCSECEAMVNAVGEWDDETEAKAGISLICSVCYERARDLNQSTETGQK